MFGRSAEDVFPAVDGVDHQGAGADDPVGAALEIEIVGHQGDILAWSPGLDAAACKGQAGVGSAQAYPDQAVGAGEAKTAAAVRGDDLEAVALDDHDLAAGGHALVSGQDADGPDRGVDLVGPRGGGVVDIVGLDPEMGRSATEGHGVMHGEDAGGIDLDHPAAQAVEVVPRGGTDGLLEVDIGGRGVIEGEDVDPGPVPGVDGVDNGVHHQGGLLDDPFELVGVDAVAHSLGDRVAARGGVRAGADGVGLDPEPAGGVDDVVKDSRHQFALDRVAGDDQVMAAERGLDPQVAGRNPQIDAAEGDGA